MSLFFKFAFRNLFRHSRRTWLTVLAMTFGLTINFWLDCMLRGRNHEVVRFVTSAYTGNFQIYSKAFFDEKSVNHQLDFDLTQLPTVLGEKAHYSPRVHLPSLVSSGEYSLPVLAQGITPDLEKNVSTIKQAMVEGEFLSDTSTCSPGEIVIGKKLAAALKVGLGEKIVLLTQSADGNLGNELFRVKGLYDTGSSNFDKAYVFIYDQCAKELGVVQHPHEIVISVVDAEKEDQVFSDLKKLISPDQMLATWEQSLPAVSRMVHVNNAIMGMVSVILLVVVILGFVNTLLMSVMERTKEIGMMMALGVSPGQVRLIIVLESVLIALFSSALAIVLGLLIVGYHSMVGFDLTPFVGDSFEANQFSFSLMLYPKVSIWPFFKVIFFSLIIVIFSVLLPAYRASKLTPLDAIRS